MTNQITEFHTSPWVLPNEMIMGWLKWSGNDPVQSIRVIADANITFEELLSYSGAFNPTEGTIEVNGLQLERPGYMAFVARYKSTPQTDFDLHFSAKLILSVNTILTANSKTTIVRPLLMVAGFDSVTIENSNTNPDVNIKIVNSSFAEALDVTPKVRVISKPVGAIEVETEAANSVFERVPIRLLSLTSYISKIIVRKPGEATLTLSFAYSDRLGNKYETPVREIAIKISALDVREIPITNVLQGDGDPVEIPAIIPAVVR